jgi:hypothetical protein
MRCDGALRGIVIVLLICVVDCAKYRCQDVGPCVACANTELNEEDCFATGRKMKVMCTYGVDKEKEDFRSCNVTAEDEQNRVIVFQLLMGLLGGLSYYQVQARKVKSATLFDQRQ